MVRIYSIPILLEKCPNIKANYMTNPIARSFANHIVKDGVDLYLVIDQLIGQNIELSKLHQEAAYKLAQLKPAPNSFLG